MDLAALLPLHLKPLPATVTKQTCWIWSAARSSATGSSAAGLRSNKRPAAAMQVRTWLTATCGSDECSADGQVCPAHCRRRRCRRQPADRRPHSHACLQELVRVVHDDSSGRYAVLHAGSGERICHMDSQVGAGVAAVKRWVRTPQRALGCQAFALVAPAVTPAIQPRVLGAAPTACRSIDLQEDADEVADILTAKLALQRGIPLDSVAFKQADALEEILPGLEARGRGQRCSGSRVAQRLVHQPTQPACPSTAVTATASQHSRQLLPLCAFPGNHAGSAGSIMGARGRHAHCQRWRQPGRGAAGDAGRSLGAEGAPQQVPPWLAQPAAPANTYGSSVESPATLPCAMNSSF